MDSCDLIEFLISKKNEEINKRKWNIRKAITATMALALSELWCAKAVFVQFMHKSASSRNWKLSKSKNVIPIKLLHMHYNSTLKLTGDDYLLNAINSIYFDVIKFYTNAS